MLCQLFSGQIYFFFISYFFNIFISPSTQKDMSFNKFSDFSLVWGKLDTTDTTDKL